MALAVAAGGLIGTACHPPNLVQAFGFNRTGRVSTDGHSVSLRGTIACQYPEPVHLVMATAQGFSPQTPPSIECDGPELKQWAQTFYDGDTVQPTGSTLVTIQAWTGFGDHSPDFMTASHEALLK